MQLHRVDGVRGTERCSLLDAVTQDQADSQAADGQHGYGDQCQFTAVHVGTAGSRDHEQVVQVTHQFDEARGCKSGD